MIWIILFATIGLALSWYSYIIERRLKVSPTYKPVCDLSDRISCSKPLTSPYARLFFISNSHAGMIFYGLIIVLAMLHAWKLLFIASLAGMTVSLALAYILYYKIRAFCIVCSSLYIINACILIAAYTIV